MSVNKVTLLGRLGTEPELRYTPNGSAVCNFSVATSENWTDKNTGQKNEKTEWHRIVVWGKQAELCNQYLSKGRQAYLEGKLQTRQWEDKDGNKRYTTEIVCNQVQFLGGNPNAGTGANTNTSSQPAANNPSQEMPSYDIKADDSFASDDIPF